MNLLLVDDHPLFVVGFAHALSHARGDIAVQTAPTIETGLEIAAHTGGLDAVLLDYRLSDPSGRDGLDGLRIFGQRHPLVARVLISGDEEPALVARGRSAGAAAFLSKSLAITQMLHALDVVCAGGEWFAVAAPSVGAASDPTARQLEVLSLVAQGWQNKQIARELGIAERTVKLHVTALLDTLDARNRTHLLVRARELGLI